MPELQPEDPVRLKLDDQKGWGQSSVVVTSTHEPRSQLVQTENGSMLRKNRKHLQPVPEPLSSVSEHVTPEDQ